MNKTALKSFATNARRELLKKVEAKAMKIGITEDNIKKADIESSDAVFIDGRQLSKEEKIQRDRLIDRIKQIGFNQVMEEVSYTWFNRFTALRFMEVNDYLPTKVRVLSSINAGSTEPDMMKEAISLDLDLDKEYLYNLKMNNSSEELFKYLIIKHCNDLNRYMPFMFETIDDYTEILFPEGLLATDSFIRYMTNTDIIPEDNWEEIEVIGWLYQYYIAEEKDRVFSNLKKNIKITKDTLPAATQLFTPNWIVRYMVENSLGRIWLDSYSDSHLRTEWKYYVDEAEQEQVVINQLEGIRYKNVNPEEITFLDPCCGSGHILVYAFDVFYDMYLEKGYVESEIPQLILEKNLYGLDVDDRAAQLASFALMMKAREKSRRIFRQGIQPNVYSLQESNWLMDEMIENISGNDNETKEVITSIRDAFIDAKEYGSILEIEPFDYELIERRLHEYSDKQADLIELIDKQKIEDRLPLLLKQSLFLCRKYDVVCTNPPYMGSKGMNVKLSKYLQENYPSTKSDMSTVMMEKSLSMCKSTGVISMINIPVWMFLKSYEKLRQSMIKNNTFLSMLHLGRGVFGSDFGTTAFVISKSLIPNYQGVYRRLFKKEGAVDNLEQKEKWFFENLGYYIAKQEEFCKIPGSPIAYWVKNTKIFENQKVGDFFISGGRNKTHNNEKYIRYFWEVSHKDKKWTSYLNGGEYKKYYGNDIYVVNWSEEAKEFYASHGGLVNPKFWNKKGITWNLITSANPGFRLKEESSQYSSGSPTIFNEEYEYDYYLLGFLNSKVSLYLLKILNPTINTTVGDVLSLPYISNEKKSKIIDLVSENIDLAKDDWNSFETSRNFLYHPLIKKKLRSNNLSETFSKLKIDKEQRFNKMWENEEEINRIFIELLSFQNDINSKINSEDVTINKVSNEEIKSLVSYAIGCSLGRYSLDHEGLVYAGGEFNPTQYQTFAVARDNILPILPEAYFEDDIVSRFINFVRITFGEEALSENLNFVADALGRKKGETAKETLQRYFLNDFYQDHLKTYNKRPVYWLFTSGKEKAFNCLIYMHRYDKTTLSRIRTDYLHDYQIRLDAEKKDLLNIIDGDSTAKEISNAKKELKSLEKKIDELKAYDELLHHMADMQIEIDLDDGVKVNYEKFEGLVAKI
ncbi:BREX-1 system adenine-specific DNA-methyltransferase PglX [Niallia sp. JL1B1071]|uniref:BREX-1 system adenine-specific DNA-methyltransferase PglX n=1 Tax=Niallia tiangongensis TaxID=3237105 RepID=UPI0037DC0E7B